MKRHTHLRSLVLLFCRSSNWTNRVWPIYLHRRTYCCRENWNKPTRGWFYFDAAFSLKENDNNNYYRSWPNKLRTRDVLEHGSSIKYTLFFEPVVKTVWKFCITITHTYLPLSQLECTILVYGLIWNRTTLSSYYNKYRINSYKWKTRIIISSSTQTLCRWILIIDKICMLIKQFTLVKR